VPWSTVSIVACKANVLRVFRIDATLPSPEFVAQRYYHIQCMTTKTRQATGAPFLVARYRPVSFLCQEVEAKVFGGKNKTTFGFSIVAQGEKLDPTSSVALQYFFDRLTKEEDDFHRFVWPLLWKQPINPTLKEVKVKMDSHDCLEILVVVHGLTDEGLVQPISQQPTSHSKLPSKLCGICKEEFPLSIAKDKTCLCEMICLRACGHNVHSYCVWKHLTRDEMKQHAILCNECGHVATCQPSTEQIQKEQQLERDRSTPIPEHFVIYFKDLQGFFGEMKLTPKTPIAKIYDYVKERRGKVDPSLYTLGRYMQPDKLVSHYPGMHLGNTDDPKHGLVYVCGW
jgi:hypothetical protein